MEEYKPECSKSNTVHFGCGICKPLDMKTTPDTTGIEEVVYNIMHDCESYIADSSNKEWFKERVSLNFHHQLQKALRCGKDMGDGSVCGCKLDCHLHDWRQRDELQKARQDWLREIEEVMRVDIGDASPTRLALRALLYRHQEELNKQ